MWSLLVFVSTLVLYTSAQNDRIQRRFENSHGFNIRLAVPGDPGTDYPLLNSIPRTSFTCSGKNPGYYADIETSCQVFRVCTIGATYGFQSFLCPNGTLFNQAVFVCDWWMQVNCEKTNDIVNRNNDQIKNVKLGPQFMSDIKKMITHPMRNPYDKAYIKNDVFVVQEYKPPGGQLYSGNNYKTNHNIRNEFSPNVQQQRNTFRDIFSNTDTSFAASTPSTRHISNYNYFNSQKQSSPYQHLIKAQNTNLTATSNAHGGQASQNTNKNAPQLKTLNSEIKSVLYNNRSPAGGRQTIYSIDYSKHQLNPHIQQEPQLYSPGPTRARFSKEIAGNVEKETKQNLVSNETQPHLITKTLAYRQIVKDAKDGAPRSRITFKTWIVRPSKTSKLIDNSKANNKNTEFIQIMKSENTNNTLFSSKRLALDQANKNEKLYKYNSLRTSSRQVNAGQEVPDSLISSTTSYVNYNYPIATMATPIYLAPTTFKPSSTLYIPPIDKLKQASRQYLIPNFNNIKYIKTTSSPISLYQVPIDKYQKEPKIIISKQSYVSANNNNLTFSDILTKENLDITVGNIVKDTNKLLVKDYPEVIRQSQNNIESLGYPVRSYLPPGSEVDQQSDEKLTLVTPPQLPKSSRLIATLSPSLEPPFESSEFNQTFNEVPSEPRPTQQKKLHNTIERTVSLKITIPENIAELLFKSHNSKHYNLELLNTESSKYLVLTNDNYFAKNGGTNFIPIGKLVENNISNISNSQDLVFSLLADSLNTAKEYTNIAQQNTVTPSPIQYLVPKVQTNEVSTLSKDSSRIISPQHSNNGLWNQQINTEQSTIQPQIENKNSLSEFTLKERIQPTLENIKQLQGINSNQFNTPQYEKPTLNLVASPGNIYSGQLYQLPVPDVTKQIYNSLNPSISNFILSNSFLPTQSHLTNEAEVEIIPSQIIPTPSFQQDEIKETSKKESSNNIFDNFQVPKNVISAHIQDNIIGTIPHPNDNDKLIKYKKDQSYHFYSHLNNNNNLYSNNGVDKTNKIYLLSNLTQPTFQFIPSVGYKLDDEIQKQNILSVFHIDEYGSPKRNNVNENANVNRRYDVSSDVDFTVTHPTSLYNGPNAHFRNPTISREDLELNQNSINDPYYSGRIEKFDNYDNDLGYPKVTPTKKFVF